ncbi:DUF5681 domain-containing protein [Sphingomonas asaccharolytica]|uniref:DUF5681 domain-containing protein n=1 Tax=Sphingomonas asaccharolytica TaxID=40681 RepID=UPI00082CFC50|nr:DUF5681 domain-containing protein [Sphingomonas asaccharolytica]
MDDNDDYEVGYKRPPKTTRFKKGQCANPTGRRGKKQKPAPQDNSDRAIIERLSEELIEHNGRMITVREAELLVIRAKALKGDLKAIQMWQALREKLAPKNEKRGGVLLVPCSVPLDEWEASTARQQAPFREQTFEKFSSGSKEDER